MKEYEGHLDVLWPDRPVDLHSKNDGALTAKKWKSVVGNKAWFSLVALSSSSLRNSAAKHVVKIRADCWPQAADLAPSRLFLNSVGQHRIIGRWLSVVVCFMTTNTDTLLVVSWANHCFVEHIKIISYPTVGSCNVRNPMINKQFEDDSYHRDMCRNFDWAYHILPQWKSSHVFCQFLSVAGLCNGRRKGCRWCRRGTWELGGIIMNHPKFMADFFQVCGWLAFIIYLYYITYIYIKTYIYNMYIRIYRETRVYPTDSMQNT